MALPLPLLLLAGAAILLLGKSGDDDDGDSGGNDGGDGGTTASVTGVVATVQPTDPADPDPDATIKTVAWGDLSGMSTGTGDTWGENHLGEEHDRTVDGEFLPGPINWPITAVGDELRISGAPLTKTLGTGSTVENPFRLHRVDTDVDPWIPELSESIEMISDTSKGELVLRAKTTTPGKFYVQHYTFGTVESGPNAGSTIQTSRTINIEPV